MIFTEFVCDSAFADRACILAFKPLRDAICMEAMKAGQDDIILLDFIQFLTDCTLFVLFAKVRRVGCCELTLWKKLENLARHRVDHIFVQLQELFILLRVLSVVGGVLITIISELILGGLIMVHSDLDQRHVVPLTSATPTKTIPAARIIIIVIVISPSSSHDRLVMRSSRSVPSSPPAPVRVHGGIVADAAHFTLHTLQSGEQVDRVAPSHGLLLLLFSF